MRELEQLGVYVLEVVKESESFDKVMKDLESDRKNRLSWKSRGKKDWKKVVNRRR